MTIIPSNKILETLVSLAYTTILILIIFFFGVNYGRKETPIIEVQHDTTYVYDTSWYSIRDSIVDKYELDIMLLEGKIRLLETTSPKVDTVYIPTVESVSEALISSDTMDLLMDYFSIYDYTWLKTDSDIDIAFTSTITQNKPIAYELNYKILRPTEYIETIINEDKKDKLLQIGLNSILFCKREEDINVGIDITYTSSNCYYGATYYPINNAVGVRFGFNLLRF